MSDTHVAEAFKAAGLEAEEFEMAQQTTSSSRPSL
jgi:hypothetical protein